MELVSLELFHKVWAPGAIDDDPDIGDKRLLALRANKLIVLGHRYRA